MGLLFIICFFRMQDMEAKRRKEEQEYMKLEAINAKNAVSFIVFHP